MANFEEIIKKHVGEDGNIPANAIGSIVSEIKSSVGNEYVEKERYKAKLTEIDTLKEKQQNAEDTATTAEKWKDKYTDMKKQFEDYKVEQAAKETKAAKEKAYTEILKDAGITTEKAIAKVIKYTNFNELELDDSGKIKDAKERMKSVKEEWSELVSQTTTAGADTPHPPTTGKGGGMSKEEIMQIKDTTERQRALREYIQREE